MTKRARFYIGLGIAAGVLLLVAANTHLVYVAVASAPDCVDHVKIGDNMAAAGTFRAARSSC